MPGIKKVSIREPKLMLPDADAAEGFRNENTWVLDTEGTNLLDVSSCLLCHASAYLYSAVSRIEVWSGACAGLLTAAGTQACCACR